MSHKHIYLAIGLLVSACGTVTAADVNFSATSSLMKYDYNAGCEGHGQVGCDCVAGDCTSGGCATGDCAAGDCGAGGCASACGSCDACRWCDERLLGIIRRSDRCYRDYISPMTNPVWFEDPRTLTELRFIYLHHKVPLDPVGGGEVNAFAMQIRAALTERLSLIATEDGYLTSSNPIVDDGWLDINVGLKYNLFANPCTQTLLSVGATYEMPVGSHRAAQANGDGVFNIFSSGGIRLGEYNLLSGAGFILPVDGDANSSFFYWSAHASREIGCTGLYPFIEANWYSYIDSGNNPAIIGVEGGDLFNLGAQNVTNNDIVTGAIGLKYQFANMSEAGVGWEVPLSGRRDVLDNRLHVNWIVRY